MGMPTFDWSNILRKLVFIPGMGFSTYVNPVRLFLAFAIGLGVLVSTISSFFLRINLSFFTNFDVHFVVEDNDIKSFIFYVVAADYLIPILDTLINFLAALVPFLIAFLGSYFALAFTYRLSSAFRNWLLSMSGNG